jgi:hypothetical protein
MSEATTPSIDDFAISLEFTVAELNSLLNTLNTPHQAPATTLVGFINAIQRQAGPQVVKAKESLAAVEKAQDEPKTTS